ncbi:hypothetical protein O181_055579 [Austropuccinia psidii MF-1]|uniref:Uncharacterized protein n=1 Tax=Austropuccinia psidii MF-1 TaxID=1389203 RepID=A0A9Q3E6S5_9BASI|nr:hypothetical protein [Austropuccinia psidii MF-1]
MSKLHPKNAHTNPQLQEIDAMQIFFILPKFVPSLIRFTTSNPNPASKRPPCQDGQIQLHGQPRLHNPKSRFISQLVLSWVTWLLNIPGVEESIEGWAHKKSSHQDSIIFDVTQGSVWKEDFSSGSSASPELGFGLFVDWFNPRGKKTAGKKLSIGIIVLYCFNLQPRERFQPRYTCLAGVIPSPNHPDMITINNIMRPLIDQLILLNPVIQIKTPNHPHG